MKKEPQIELTSKQLTDWRQQVEAALDQDYYWSTLALVAKGLSTKEVALKLDIPSGIVKNRLQAMVQRVSMLAPTIGVLRLDRTGLSTVYRYATGSGLCLVGEQWVDEAHTVLKNNPGQKATLAALPLGLSNAQIGQREYLAGTTVKIHLYHLGLTLAQFNGKEGIVRLNRTGLAGLALMMGHTDTARLV